jgi:predicted aminopeptidase
LSGAGRRVRRAAAWTAVAVGLCGCYVSRQALHQNDLYNSRRPIEIVLADERTPAKVRDGLALTREILAYAKAQGLRAEGAYRYFVGTDEPYVSYLVQAAYADRLELLTWWFPVVGRVPYLGYFEKGERDAEADRLRAGGYDVSTSGVGAFSSLGWFEDPLFTSMVLRGRADLAHLLFHELTHRTLWVPGSVEFNENLAEYVGDAMTEQFLSGGAPGDAERLEKYRAKREDKELFRAWLVRLKAELTRTYARLGAAPRAQVLAAKAAVFERYLKAPERPRFKAADFIGSEPWNNATVLGASLYAPDPTRFAAARTCLGRPSLHAFLVALEAQLEAGAADGFAALDALCDPAKRVRLSQAHVD